MVVKMQIEAVIFDMDGTLFDTEKVSQDCFLKVAREIGYPHMEEISLDCIGLSRGDILSLLQNRLGKSFPAEEYLQMTSRRMKETMEKDGPPIMDGAVNLLNFLKEKGMKMGLASSSRVDTIKSHLERTNLTSYFSIYIGGDMVEYSKPKPHIYWKACKELRVAPENSFAIEDSPNGVRSAFQAGLKTIMVPNMIKPAKEVEDMLFKKCSSLEEVQNYFEKIL